MTLLLGRYQDVLADVEVDLTCADPPYGSRTHEGQATGEMASRGDRGGVSLRPPIPYDHWTATDVHAFVGFMAPRTKGWLACMTCSDLINDYRDAYENNGLVSFAPVPCVIPAMTCRMAGDGPSSWAVYLMVGRPKALFKWGTLRGSYSAKRGAGVKRNRCLGGKPLPLMTQIVRDYSRPGDLVCDPCAGHATTLVAAKLTGRRFIGAEMDPGRHAAGLARLDGTIAEGQTPIEMLARKNGSLL